MRDTSKKFRVRSKIWVEDARGKLVLGPGRLRIFDSIQRTGSMHAAAKELGMSYRAVWGKIKATEERLGERLLVKTVGGREEGQTRACAKSTQHHILATVRQNQIAAFHRLEPIFPGSHGQIFGTGAMSAEARHKNGVTLLMEIFGKGPYLFWSS